MEKEVESTPKKNRPATDRSVNLADLSKMKLPKLSWLDDEEDAEPKARLGRRG
jgi:hypothetical protein